MTTTDEIYARVDALEALLAPALEKDEPAETVALLMNLALRRLARAFPPTLTPEDRAKIQKNYRAATPSLIKERALAPPGLVAALAAGEQLQRIALDYSPLSYWKDEGEQDEQADPAYRQQLAAFVGHAFATGAAARMSSFGTAVTLILLTVREAGRQGVPFPKVIRGLVDGAAYALRSAQVPSADEEEVQMMVETFGVSREEAEAYVAYTRKAIIEGAGKP